MLRRSGGTIDTRGLSQTRNLLTGLCVHTVHPARGLQKSPKAIDMYADDVACAPRGAVMRQHGELFMGRSVAEEFRCFES
jgi:hypothetical protein